MSRELHNLLNFRPMGCIESIEQAIVPLIRVAVAIPLTSWTVAVSNACGYTKILADKMTPSLQKLGSRGIFQHDAKIMQKKNYDLAKYVA